MKKKREQQNEFGWGEKRKAIANAIREIIKEDQSINSPLVIRLSVMELHQRAKEKLEGLVFGTSDVINAIRRDDELKKDAGIKFGPHEDYLIKVYSHQMMHVLDMVSLMQQQRKHPPKFAHA